MNTTNHTLVIHDEPNRGACLRIDRWHEKSGLARLLTGKFELALDYVDWHQEMPAALRIETIEYLVRHSMVFAEPAYSPAVQRLSSLAPDAILCASHNDANGSATIYRRIPLHIRGSATRGSLLLPVAEAKCLRPALGSGGPSDKPPVSMRVRSQTSSDAGTGIQQKWAFHADEIAARIDAWVAKARNYDDSFIKVGISDAARPDLVVDPDDLPFCHWAELTAEDIATEACGMLWFKAATRFVPEIMRVAKADHAKATAPKTDPDLPFGARWDADWNR